MIFLVQRSQIDIEHFSSNPQVSALKLKSAVVFEKIEFGVAEELFWNIPAGKLKGDLYLLMDAKTTPFLETINESCVVRLKTYCKTYPRCGLYVKTLNVYSPTGESLPL